MRYEEYPSPLAATASTLIVLAIAMICFALDYHDDDVPPVPVVSATGELVLDGADLDLVGGPGAGVLGGGGERREPGAMIISNDSATSGLCLSAERKQVYSIDCASPPSDRDWESLASFGVTP